MGAFMQKLWPLRWGPIPPVTVLLFLLIALIPRTTKAQTAPAFTIETWEAPKSCGDPGHFAALVRDALGVPEAGSGYAESLVVSIEISAKDRGFTLRLSTGTDTNKGERVLRAKECEEVLQSAALVLSLSLAPELLYQNESSRSVFVSQEDSDTKSSNTPELVNGNKRQENDEETPDFAPIAATPAASVSFRRSSRLREIPPTFPVSLHLALVSDIGTLPRPGFGLALEASGEKARFRVALRFTKWAEQDETLDNSLVGQGGHFDFLESSLFVCHKLVRTIGLCAIGSVGRLSVSAINIEEPIGQTHPMANLGGGLYWKSRPLGHWQFLVQADLLAQLIKPRYTAEVLEQGSQNSLIEMQIHQPSPLAGRFSASVGAYF